MCPVLMRTRAPHSILRHLTSLSFKINTLLNLFLSFTKKKIKIERSFRAKTTLSIKRESCLVITSLELLSSYLAEGIEKENGLLSWPVNTVEQCCQSVS